MYSEVFTKFLNKSYKNLHFSNYCKAYQYIKDFKISGLFVIQGCQNRDSKSGYKKVSKEELFQNTKYFKLLLGATK